MAAKWSAQVDEFVSVTGASIERAGSLLEACNGNLTMAIEMHFDSASESVPIASNSASADTSTANEIDKDEDIRAPIPQTRGVLVEEPYSTFTARKRTSRSVFDAFRDFQAEAKQQEAIGTSSSLKRKTLQDLFRPPIDLLHKGTFETAKLDGQQHGKWLLVNVQDVKEFACQQLNRDVWSSDAVRTIVKEHFVLWQVYKDSAEGERFIHFYHVTSFPSLTVLDPRTGEKLAEWNGATNPQAFCECATEFTLEHPSLDGSTPPSKKRKRESIVDASEDSQLQAAIAASLTYTQSKNDCAEESSDEDDMGFSDSSSEGQPSPKKAPLAHRVNFKETVITSDEVFKPNGGSKSSTMGSCSKSPAAPTFIRSLDNAFKNEQSLGGGGNRVNDGDVNVEGGAQSEIDGMNSAAKPAAKSEKVTQESASSKEQSSLKSRYEKKAPDAQTSDSEVVAANVTDSRCSEAYKVEDASDGKGKQAKTEPDQNTVGNVQMDEQKGSCAENGMENQEETTSGALCKIMVRFPNGTRKPVSLSADSTLMALVKFVGNEGYPNERYELVTNFPRRKLSYLDFKTTLRAAGLYPQEAVFVQER